MIHARPVQAPEHQGRVLLPENIKQKMALGTLHLWTVLAVGPGRMVKGTLHPVECQPGDRILTAFEGAGAQALGDGTSVLSEETVIAIIQG